MKKKNQPVRCSGCGRAVIKSVAYKKGSKLFCCPDCAAGKTCDCQ